MGAMKSLLLDLDEREESLVLIHALEEDSRVEPDYPQTFEVVTDASYLPF